MAPVHLSKFMIYTAEDFRKLLSVYLLYIRTKVFGVEDYAVKDITYWQNELFIKTVAFTLPVSFVVLIPSLIISFQEGALWIAVAELLTLTSISFFILYTRFAIKTKMLFSVTVLTLFAGFLIAASGFFGIGSLYLLAVSILISLLFSGEMAYLSIAINLLMLCAFSLLIYFRLFSWLIVQHYKIEVWLTYCLNFVFLNSLVVVEIRHILSGLQTTINKEEKLLETLHAELEDRTERNLRLADSEGHYKSLFFNNPTPMWIFDATTLYFLQVNDAAVMKYGYSCAEFTNMTIDQIRVEPLELIRKGFETTMHNQSVFSNVALHQKKDGKQFYVKVKCSTIPFQGQQALLVIAQDITTEVSRNQAIEQQNDKLKAIAYMQSHTVRAPLARIKGLWELLALDPDVPPDPQLFSYMKASIEELDQVIRTITRDSSPVAPEGNPENLN